MLIVETIGRIRRAHSVQGKSIKEIVRHLRVSRNTARRVLRSAETEFIYERTVQPRPKLGARTAELEWPLVENEARARRDRPDLIRIYEDLRTHGAGGGYDAVRRYARARASARVLSPAASIRSRMAGGGKCGEFFGQAVAIQI
jgi:hypothetical protein